MCTKLQTLTDFEYFLSNIQSWLGLAVMAYEYSPGLTSSLMSPNKTAWTLTLVFGVSFLRVGVYVYTTIYRDINVILILKIVM